MEWIIGLVALPLTAVSTFWPVIRDRSRLAELERVAKLVDTASLSESERHRLSAYRRRLTRQVFVQKMLYRRVWSLAAGLYGVIVGPGLLVTALVLLVTSSSPVGDVLTALYMAVVITVFGGLILGLRTHRIRQQARKLLALYRSPVDPIGLGRLVQRSSLREPGGEGVE